MSDAQHTATASEWRDASLHGEEWRDVVLDQPEQPAVAAYQVSNFGRLRSRVRQGGKIGVGWRLLDGHVTTWGYRVYNLYGDLHFAHRLVAFAFLGPPGAGQVVRHLDGNALNNVVNNLAWGTDVENAADRMKHGRHATGEKSPVAVLTEGNVREIVRLWREGKLRYELARQFNVTPENIASIVSGRTWCHVTGLHPGHPDAAGPGDRDRWQARGERNNSKLSVAQVEEIVRRCRAGETRRSVAKAFRVCSTTVNKIMNGKKWRSVTGIVPPQADVRVESPAEVNT